MSKVKVIWKERCPLLYLHLSKEKSQHHVIPETLYCTFFEVDLWYSQLHSVRIMEGYRMSMGEGNKRLEDNKWSRVTNCESFDFICIEPIDQCFFWILDI